MPRGRCPAPRRDRRRGPARTAGSAESAELASHRPRRRASARGDRAAQADRAAPASRRAGRCDLTARRRRPRRSRATRRLIGASFDLLNRSSDEMRRASFYIGLVVLGTVGPLALASWALEVVALHKTNAEMDSILAGGAAALAGVPRRDRGRRALLVAAVESRTMASALLGGRLAGRPSLSVRGSLARSRMSFWRVVIGSFVVAIPVAIAQVALGAVFEATLGRQTDVSIVSTTLAAALVGAPLRVRAERHRPRRRRPVRGDSPVVPRLPGEEGRPRPWSRSSRRPRPCSSSSACRPASTSPCASSARSASAPTPGRLGWCSMTLGIMAGVFALGTLIYTALRHRGGAADRDVRRPDAGDVRPRPRPAGRRSRPATVRARPAPVPLADDPDAARLRVGGLVGLGAFVVILSD